VQCTVIVIGKRNLPSCFCFTRLEVPWRLFEKRQRRDKSWN
jgi:hypothetical protein